MSTVTQFVSYATKYDLYTGDKGWNELTITEQNEILRAELLAQPEDISPDDLVMKHNLIKAQAQGLRGIVVASALALERAQRIPDATAWDEAEMALIIEFLKGTAFAKRFGEVAANTQKNVTPLPEEVLESLSATESLDDMLDMGLSESQAYLRELLMDEEEESGSSLSYEDFKSRLAAGNIYLIVDKGMAVTAARSGFNAGAWGLICIGLFTLSLLMIIPAIFIWGFWAAIGFTIGALILFRLTRNALVQRVRQAVLENEEWYALFLKKGVIYLLDKNGKPL